MANIFTKDDNFVDKPKRNTFDLSYQNNLSLKFGQLIPAYIQEVIPGDGINIKPTFGLRYLPQVFPVQTRMRAHLHFFYVRNRTIWKNWMDFIGKTKDNLVVPYLSPDRFDNELLTESSIYDYMGLPLTIDSDVNDDNLIYTSKPKSLADTGITPEGNVVKSLNMPFSNDSFIYEGNEADKRRVILNMLPTPINVSGIELTTKYIISNESPDKSYDSYIIFRGYIIGKSVNDSRIFIRHGSITSTAEGEFNLYLRYTLPNGEIFQVTQILGYYYEDGIEASVDYKFGIQPSINHGFPLSSVDSDYLPYNSNVLRINALPFRAYEAVYNSFYRNPENNPFLINGVPEYNKYVVNDGDGQCRLSEFKLYNRNWEDDAFTTAVPTPQQGDAPRVGLTADRNTPIFLNYSREDGSVGKLVLEADPDGYVHAVSADNLTGNYNDDIENTSMANMLNDVTQFGITINDLRNVNSFQRWLEKNVRKGYRYRDQLMSHYGVSVSYKDMMMPEFIGGMSRDVTVNQISQTVETDTGNLGDMAGQAYVIGDGKPISHFCDEHGYIIGILSVVPVPNYSQMIPKHFFKHDALDYFFPEFGKIGMQPIANKEIAAIASYLEGNSDKTFGYQRAWYDYLARVDEVHGMFNSDFYNFLIQRKFDGVPQLGASFTTVNNDDLNNIFYSDDGKDKILGQIYYDVSGIRPIPMYGIPSLE